MKKIIVPIDFSPLSFDALNFALEFNTRIKGEIILLHVLESPNYAFSVMGETYIGSPEEFYNGKLVEGVHNRLEEWTQRVKDVGQKAKAVMRHGHPYQNIGREIAREKADWIILGSKGASGLKEIFIGSNAERVIRYAECPVITIKGAAKISEMKNMVFASDLTEEQDWMAEKAKEIQKLLGLNMHIVKIRTPYNFLTAEAADRQLKSFADRNHFEDFTLNHTEAEYSDEGIVAFAEEVGAGIIILSTHGKTRLAHLFGGSRAEDLANESKIPVITMKLPLTQSCN